MSVLLNKDTKGINVAVVPRYTTRKATDRVIRKQDGGFVIVNIKNPKQLIDIMATATLYGISNDGKYYPMTTDNSEVVYEKLSKNETIDSEVSAQVDTDKVAEVLGSPRITTFFTANGTAPELHTNCVFSNGELKGTFFEYTGTRADAKPAENKDGYFVYFDYDQTSATKYKIEDVKLIVTGVDKWVDISSGTNAIWLGNNPKLSTIVVKAKIDGKVTEETVKVTIETIEKRSSNDLFVQPFVEDYKTPAPNSDVEYIPPRYNNDNGIGSGNDHGLPPGPIVPPTPTVPTTDTSSESSSTVSPGSSPAGKKRKNEDATTPGHGRSDDGLPGGGVGSAAGLSSTPTVPGYTADDHL